MFSLDFEIILGAKAYCDMYFCDSQKSWWIREPVRVTLAEMSNSVPVSVPSCGPVAKHPVSHLQAAVKGPFCLSPSVYTCQTCCLSFGGLSIRSVCVPVRVSMCVCMCVFLWVYVYTWTCYWFPIYVSLHMHRHVLPGAVTCQSQMLSESIASCLQTSQSLWHSSLQDGHSHPHSRACSCWKHSLTTGAPGE